MFPPPPPPLPLTPPDEEPDYANLGGLDSNGRFVAVVALALFSPLVIDLLSLAFLLEGGGVFLSVVFVNFMSVKFVLLALWVAWGGSRLVVRLIVVGFSLAITSLAGGPDGVKELWPQLFILLLAIASTIAVPRAFGSRWVTITAESHGIIPPRTGNARQFSLFDIFIWTTTIAVLLGVFRWVDPPRWFLLHAWLALLIYSGIFGASMLLFLWAMLGPEGTVTGRFWIVWLLGLSIGFVLGLLTRSGEGLFLVTFATVLFASLTMGSLAVLRANGARFVWRDGGYYRGY